MDKKGQVVIVVIAILVLLMIVVPAVVRTVMSESRWTVREKRVSQAEYLAEAGIERGLWLMQSDEGYWDLLLSSAIPGYSFDAVYRDVPSTGAVVGAYAIRLSTGSMFGTPVAAGTQRVITAVGRDESSAEVATIELLIQTPGVVRAPLIAQTVSVVGTGEVHWGPILSLSSLTLSGAAIERFPRKFARGQIAAGPNNTDLDPAQPNYDTDNPNPHTEFWSFNEPPGVPDPPTVDLPFYKYLAQCSSCAVAAGFPGGGYYYPANIVVSNAKDTQLTVRYAEGTLKFTGCVATMGVTISHGHLNFNGGACNVAQAPVGRYPQTVNIPDSAWLEYRKIDTAAGGQYPGDLGGPGSGGLSPTYTFGAGSNTNSQATLTMSHFGLVYAVSTWGGAGGTVIVGAVMAPSDTGAGAGGVRIYYQDDLNIRGTPGTGFDRVLWDRKPAYWPPGL